jgi:hypothetical protein
VRGGETLRSPACTPSFINKAATEYADAIQLHGLEVWGEDQEAAEDDHEVDKMITENKYKTKQIELIEEQMQIITIGWGHKDLAYKKNGSVAAAVICVALSGSWGPQGSTSTASIT